MSSFKQQDEILQSLDHLKLHVTRIPYYFSSLLVNCARNLPEAGDVTCTIIMGNQNFKAKVQPNTKNPFCSFHGYKEESFATEIITFELYIKSQIIACHSLKIANLEYGKEEEFKIPLTVQPVNKPQPQIIKGAKSLFASTSEETMGPPMRNKGPPTLEFKTKFPKAKSVTRNESVVKKTVQVSDDVDLQTALGNDVSIEFFRKYCQKEHNEENLMFYLDIENFKKIRDQEKLNEDGRRIYKEYLQLDGPHALNTTSEFIKEIDPNSNFESSSFKKIQKSMEFLMKDSYFRFITSDIYLQMTAAIEIARKLDIRMEEGDDFDEDMLISPSIMHIGVSKTKNVEGTGIKSSPSLGLMNFKKK